ncbi:diguanylate cyclase [Acidovorax sp. ACV01]|uniref:GGDEF domain-containing protein n=1 Tax=Acidovorax sp. ACV01 TaxID=2769311 RepID=UPI00177B1AA0|nr:GGDEF domain-containing protein [Acidovorax sp. ACV01]MBD9391012.1 GGDEF domain-containing protein [Acidovorax sp. ACV01]
MNVLDPRTAIVLISAMSALMALVLWALKRSYPPSIQGPGRWAQALLIIVVGGVLAASRGQLPEILTTAVPNFLLSWGVYGLYAGTQRFHGVRPATWRWLGTIAAVVLGTMWFTWGDPNYAARLRLITALMAVMFSVHAWFIVRQGMGSFSRWLTVGVLAYIAAIQLVRLATTFFLPTGDTILNATPQHALFIASFSVSILLFSVGAVLMAGDRLRAELELLATRDSLTNTLTRRYMDEACAIELERSHRTGQPLALLMMDLDHFKAINDTHGHQAGDRVLVDFATKVQSRLRNKDLLGRFGGEEFALLLPNTPLDAALQVAERIRAACAPHGKEVGCTVSIGVTLSLPQNDSMDKLLARADAALYQAKNAGRNRVVAG